MTFPLIITLIVFVVLVILIVLAKVRHSDNANAAAVWRKLSKMEEDHSPIFKVSMLEGVPPLVKSFFLYMIKPGTPLQYVAVLKMHGEFTVGSSNKSKMVDVKCKQIIAPLHGFVWQVKSTRGLLRFSGSDGLDSNHCWSRMWLMGLWPLRQKNRHDNITKSAFGRMIAESTIWSLAALLPQKKVNWEQISNSKIRVTVSTKLINQQVDITVDPSSGKPSEIVFPRWSNANPMKQFQFQSFGAQVSSFKEIQGFMVPMNIEAGNHYGTKDYSPFYKMVIDSYEFA